MGRERRLTWRRRTDTPAAASPRHPSIHTIPHPHLGSYDCGGEQAGPAGVSDIVDCVVYCMHRVCVHLINVK